MRFIQRLGYYLGGFSIGLIVLAFFFSGKRTSCAYFPQARVKKNLTIKKKTYAPEVMEARREFNLDTMAIHQLLKTGSIDFGASETRKEPCGHFIINSEDAAGNTFQLLVENCPQEVQVLKITRVAP